MRKDHLSSYQAQKLKLKEIHSIIKKLLKECWDDEIETITHEEIEKRKWEAITQIWEIVMHED